MQEVADYLSGFGTVDDSCARRKGGKMTEKLWQDREWLEKHYVREQMSATKMGHLAGCTDQTILRWMRSYDIPRRRRLGPHGALKEELAQVRREIDRLQHQVGYLLTRVGGYSPGARDRAKGHGEGGDRRAREEGG